MLGEFKLTFALIYFQNSENVMLIVVPIVLLLIFYALSVLFYGAIGSMLTMILAFGKYNMLQYEAVNYGALIHQHWVPFIMLFAVMLISFVSVFFVYRDYAKNKVLFETQHLDGFKK